jgi:poly(3-hydroxybutyrate) depolymerase
MVAAWRKVADREGIVLAAPTAHDIRHWHVRDDGPGLFRDLIGSVEARVPIDPQRVYLFGHSGGAVYVLTLALLESEYFAAAAVHAGAWRTPREFTVLAHARRKIPVALFMGDRDQYFPIRSVHETDAALRRQGHPTLLRVVPRHRHDYARVAAQVNEEAWQFLRGITLNAHPRFQSYESSFDPARDSP